MGIDNKGEHIEIPRIPGGERKISEQLRQERDDTWNKAREEEKMSRRGFLQKGGAALIGLLTTITGVGIGVDQWNKYVYWRDKSGYDIGDDVYYVNDKGLNITGEIVPRGLFRLRSPFWEKANSDGSKKVMVSVEFPDYQAGEYIVKAVPMSVLNKVPTAQPELGK
ncbi:MAG: hypothetical protein WC596_00520 [Candidatus Shapirobacteria bacterium]